MPKVCDMKKGAVVEINGAPHILQDLTISSPTARGGATLYRMRFRNLITQQKLDGTHKGDDMLGSIDFSRRSIQFSYQDQDRFVFMDEENFNEYSFSAEDIEDERPYLADGLEGLLVMIVDGRALGVELPPAVELKVAETGPSMKGASASARTKPATLTTGLVIQVPEYLETGEIVRVDTRTGGFLGRA
ncbi:MAG: elongation factor P-like protein YeiP [Verrucomicrobia bacterium]|nr:elongation factor P-like protein YeiP [Verrucomicrobiota bacterium]MDA1087338.1 elongation factor P-like protein YeiP [Verrucomicrobiota bacterium]